MLTCVQARKVKPRVSAPPAPASRGNPTSQAVEVSISSRAPRLSSSRASASASAAASGPAETDVSPLLRGPSAAARKRRRVDSVSDSNDDGDAYVDNEHTGRTRPSSSPARRPPRPPTPRIPYPAPRKRGRPPKQQESDRTKRAAPRDDELVKSEPESDIGTWCNATFPR